MTNRNRLILFVSLIAVLTAAGLTSFLLAMRQNLSGGPERTTSSYSMGLSAGGAPAPSTPSADMGMQYDLAQKGSIMPPVPQPTAGETAAEVDQKIIKNGSLQLVVDDVAKSADALTAMA